MTSSHSDTDVVPERSVEFGAQIARPQPPYEQNWVRLDFELAGLARARPHSDDERLGDVTGYDIVPKQRFDGTEQAHDEAKAEWLRTGSCPDRQVYWTSDSSWLTEERPSWAYRQRTGRAAAEAIHSIVNGSDGFVEVMAVGFTWTGFEMTAGPPIGPGGVLSTGIWEP
ncbi:MAG: hypothetical protein H6518_05595 [Microthrixaceae bacterium]|nr:hypothetical protein [Microthrixaceae bacterium]